MVKTGFSLIEILVVISIFSVLGIIITRTIFLTTRGSQKSDTIVKVRENLNYTLDVIERNLRSANEITFCDSARLYYIDGNNRDGSFYCINQGAVDGTSQVASGSAAIRLTTPTVAILSCNISCDLTANPQQALVSIRATDRTLGGVTDAIIQESRWVVLRNYR